MSTKTAKTASKSKNTKETKKPVKETLKNSPRNEESGEEKLPVATIPTEMHSEIYVPLGDPNFNWKKVVILEPKANRSQKGTWYTSACLYKTATQQLPIYFGLEKQMCWGINRTWPFSIKGEQQKLDNFDGYQICYYLTSSETVKKPTKRELQTIAIFDNIWQLTLDAGIDFCKRKVAPKSASGPYLNAKGDEGKPVWTDFIKPLYSAGTSKDETTGKSHADDTKPKKTYIEFVCKVIGGKKDDEKDDKKENVKREVICETEVYGPGDMRKDPSVYCGSKGNTVRGFGTPIIFWQDIYWGQHMSSPYGGSARLRVKEFNFEPTSSVSMSSRRMGEKNKAVEAENFEGQPEPEFDQPTGNIDKKAFKSTKDQENADALKGSSSEEERKSEEPEKSLEETKKSKKSKKTTSSEETPVESKKKNKKFDYELSEDFGTKPKAKKAPAPKKKSSKSKKDSDEDEVELSS